MKRLLPIAAAALLAASCNTSGCYDNQSSIPLAGFYSAATGKQITVNTVRITGVGAPNDSVLLTNGAPVSQVYLPMRSAYSSTAWCLHYTQTAISDPAYNDTIEFTYLTQPYFASEECGAMYRYRITGCTTTHHLVDSVEVVDSLITNVNVEQIRIYMRTADNTSGGTQ